ncbi:MAG TPA: hypothetical protein VGS57_21850 [Thermoanaerobaculia bacterium]|nr:hypothetical protein [Thermoanaerobaculia bacterium]
MSRTLATALLREQAADPWRCWIRHAPMRWPGPGAPWVDLATGTLGGNDGEPDVLGALLGLRLDDVLYVPPVSPALAAARDRLAVQHAARGTPVLVQLLPGDARPSSAATSAGLVVVWDLLAPVLAGGEASSARSVELANAQAGDAAVLPLLPGAMAGERLAALAASLAVAGLTVLQALPLELGGRDRRTLTESFGDSLSEASYLRLFHGEPPSALPVARAAARHNLLPLLPRPLPRPPLRGAANLRVAGALASCGELCLLLGEPESRAQALLRAARFAEREGRDLTALARDGHLPVLPWLEGEALQVAAEIAAGGEPELWRQLLSRLQAA